MEALCPHREVTWQGKTGTWSGRSSGTFDETGLNARFVAHGSRGFSGTSIFGSTAQEGEDLIASGHVLTTED